MKEQLKRILAAAAVCAVLPGITSAPFTGASAFAAAPASVSAEAVFAADTQYSDSASFAAKVQSIIKGECGVYADYNLTVPVSLPVGSALNTWQTYYVDAGGSGWSGMQCYIYAQGVYTVLFGAMPGNGGGSSERLHNVLSGIRELTPEALRASKVMPGAYMRTTANADLSFNGSAGHSMILLGYTDQTITILEGNANGAGAIELNTFTYAQFNNRFTTGKSRGLCQVIQPEASYYASRYGMYYSDGNGMMPAVKQETTDSKPAITSGTAATTTFAATTVTTTTATTAGATTVTTTTVTTSAATTAATTVTTTAAATAAAETAAETEAVTALPETEEQETVITDVIYISELDAPFFLPVENPEQYRWSTSNSDVAVLIWDGIAVTREDGSAVISAELNHTRYEFEICVETRDWEMLGDVNHDGSIDPMDATLVMNAYMESAIQMDDTSAVAMAAFGDVNGSGDVDLADAQLILRFYVSTRLTNSGLSARDAWKTILRLPNS